MGRLPGEWTGKKWHCADMPKDTAHVYHYCCPDGYKYVKTPRTRKLLRNPRNIKAEAITLQNNLENRSDISDISTVKANLNNIFTLVNELDLVLLYRISISEVLIYDDLPTDEDSVNIEEITSNLSNIIAQSKVNIATLPDINEFEKHKSLVKDAVTTAENLHGRYLGALRNNEYEVAQSISQAILLNKETESRAFENALLEFKEKSLLNYANFNNLP